MAKYDEQTLTLTISGVMSSTSVRDRLADYPETITLRVVDSIYLQHMPERPEDLQNVRDLIIKDCPNLRTLPTIGSATDLQVSRCENLTFDTEFPDIDYVYIRECPGLRSITPFRNASSICLDGCHGIRAIGKTRRSCLLEVANCRNIVEFDSFHETTSRPAVLTLIGLPQLTRLPALDGTHFLVVANCLALEEIGSTKILSRLDLRNCPKLVANFGMTLTKQTIINCPGVTTEAMRVISPSYELPTSSDHESYDSTDTYDDWIYPVRDGGSNWEPRTAES